MTYSFICILLSYGFGNGFGKGNLDKEIITNMPYNAYNFTNISFNDSLANCVYWSNSELVIALLIVITICQIIQTAFTVLRYLRE